MGVAQLTEPSVYAGTTCKFEFSHTALTTAAMPEANHWSAMCWAYLTGQDATYYDLIAYSDNNEVIGIGVIGPTTYSLNLGDLNSDSTSSRTTTRNEWHHYAIVCRPNGANAQVFGYLDGVRQIGPVALVAPNDATDRFFRLWNSRASSTDAASQWVGHAGAFKVWDWAITDDDIRKEMLFWRAQNRIGLFAEVPCFDTNSRTLMTGGRALDSMTVTGTFAANGFDMPGVLRDAPLSRRRVSTFLPAQFDLAQDGYRFYEDDGNEAGSTAIDAEDTNITRATGTNTRIRVQVDVTDDPDPQQFQLEWKLSTDSTWRKVR